MSSESDAKCQFRLSHCKGMTASPPPTGSWFWDEDQKGGSKGRVSSDTCDDRRSHWLNVCKAPYVECRGCTDPPKRGIVFSDSCSKKDNSDCKCVIETKGHDGWYTERTETNKDYSAGQLSYEQCRSLYASIFGGGGDGDVISSDVLKTPSDFLKNVNKSVKSTTKGVTNLKKESKDAFSDFKTLFSDSSLKETAAKGVSAVEHGKRRRRRGGGSYAWLIGVLVSILLFAAYYDSFGRHSGSWTSLLLAFLVILLVSAGIAFLHHRAKVEEGRRRIGKLRMGNVQTNHRPPYPMAFPAPVSPVPVPGLDVGVPVDQLFKPAND